MLMVKPGAAHNTNAVYVSVVYSHLCNNSILGIFWMTLMDTFLYRLYIYFSKAFLVIDYI